MEVKEKTADRAVTKPSGSDLTDRLVEPFSQLRGEVDRLFSSFPLRLPAVRLPLMPAFPAIETTETEKRYKVTAELPGIDPEDIDVSFEDGFLRIAGEKCDQREENERGYRFSERSYGAFERVVDLPAAAADADISAKFKNGVLTLTIPKKAKAAPKKRKIAIKSDS